MRLAAAALLLLAACSSSGPKVADASRRHPTTTRPTTGSTSTAPPAPGGDVGLPDPSLTPGATNSQVTQATIRSTICVTGWTATVRPPASYTDALKQQQMGQYGRRGTPAVYEEDHLVALEVGGDPRSPSNLWPEPRAGAPEAVAGRTADVKDQVENAAKSAVCSGRLPLADAQREIASDWVQLGRQLGVVR